MRGYGVFKWKRSCSRLLCTRSVGLTKIWDFETNETEDAMFGVRQRLTFSFVDYVYQYTCERYNVE